MTVYYLSANLGDADMTNSMIVGTGAPATYDFYLAMNQANLPKVIEVIHFLEKARMYIEEQGLAAGELGTDVPLP